MDSSLRQTDSFPAGAFFSLLGAGLRGLPLPDAALSDFPLGAGQWERIYETALRQTVAGILYSGLQSLPEECLPPAPLLIRWTAAADSIERRGRMMNRALAGLYGLFRSSGLDPILQKGQGIAAMYPHPLLRECGDIDFCFRSEEEKNRAASVVAGAGCRVSRMPDGSHFYRWKGVDVEHHGRLFDICSPFRKSCLSRLETGMETEHVFIEGPDGRIRLTVPSPVPNLLMLNAHVLKHAIGRGVGLRQVCDVAVAMEHLTLPDDREKLRQMERKAGLSAWSAVLYTFVGEYLGTDCSGSGYRQDRKRAARLYEIIMKGGNFGHYYPGALSAEMPGWKRKAGTAWSFIRNSGFSMSVAPAETFWTFMRLLAGQSSAGKNC